MENGRVTGVQLVDTTKVGKLLRLALSATQPGEIVGAVNALKRTIEAAGLDLHGFADAVEVGLKPPKKRASRKKATPEPPRYEPPPPRYEPPPPPPPLRREPDPYPQNWRHCVEWLLDRAAKFGPLIYSDKELRFLEQMLNLHYEATERQQAWIWTIFRKQRANMYD
jgi:hypothetical protein